ncbi:hypothetical protein HK105_206092 [Polyrhizophydium stewartii]|uniref:Adenylate kinase n=1 Tax=Polyrhizophydium stewartii TaxID=2732419 RepID=A0ABR4N483_9FUNG
MELTQALIQEALASIPPPPSVPVTPRHVYFILGKPGCGKTTLAARLAAHTETKLVSPETCLAKALSDELSPNRPQLLEHLSNGGGITPEQIIKMMQETHATDEARFKGFVLDGLPCGLNTKKTIDPELLPLDMVVLHKLLQEHEATHVPVLVHLGISDDNLVRRRAAQWLDPVTNIGYPGQQVAYSRLRRAQGWVDGQEDEVAVAEAAAAVRANSADRDALADAGASGTGAGGDDTAAGAGAGEDAAEKEAAEKEELDVDSEDADAADARAASAAPQDAAALAARAKLRAQIAIKNKTTWPILSEQILDRLIKRPEDHPDASPLDLAEYAKYDRALSELRAKYFDMQHIIDLDATQHPDIVFDQLKKCLDARVFSLTNKPVEAKRLTPPEGGFKGLADADIIRYYSALNVEDGQPRRDIGCFGNYCPVSFYNSGALVLGDMTFAAAYRGAIYSFANEAFAEQFIDNPDKYLAKPLALPSMHVAILGAPLAGKSTAAKLLALRYGLALISVERILAKWESTEPVREAKEPGSGGSGSGGGGSGGGGKKESKAKAGSNAQLLGSAAAISPPESAGSGGTPATAAAAAAASTASAGGSAAASAGGGARTGSGNGSGGGGGGTGSGEKKKGEGNLFSKIAVKLRKGAVIPTEMLTEVVKYGIRQAETQGKAGRGWVLDGYPRTGEQAKSLIAAGVIPKFVVHLQNDLNSEMIEPRHSAVLTTPTGKPTTTSTAASTQSNVRNTAETDPIMAQPFYDSLYGGYKDEINEVVRVMEESEASIVTVPSDQTIPVLLNQVIAGVDPFVPKAAVLPLKSDGALEDELGATRDYCPVMLRSSNMMVKGNKAIGAKYLGRAYYFSTEEARAAFLKEPNTFVTDVKIPPPRIVFIGPTGSGKARARLRTTCIRQLSSQWGVPHVEFHPLILEYASTLEKELHDEVSAFAKDTLAIPSPILLDVLKHLFTAEPYASKGFLLEGFPHTKLDLEAAIRNSYVPDVFVMLKVDAEVGAKRAMPLRRREIDRLRKDAEDLAKASAAAAAAEGGDAAAAAAADDEDKDAAKSDGDDTKSSSTRQFMLTDEELFEELLSGIEKDNAQNTEYSAAIEALCPTPVIEITTSRCLRPVMALLNRKLRRYLEFRHCLFMSATPITTKQAEMYLKLGVKYYSPIGKYCPVTLKRTNRMAPESYGKKPVVFGDQIYFLKDMAAKRASRAEFVFNTLSYIRDSPPQPLVAPTAIVLGACKAGKSALAAKLAVEMDAVHLTVPTILQAIIDGKEVTALYEELKACLERGETVPDRLVIEAILLVTTRVTNGGRGWVLDGFPLTLEQATALEKTGFIPHTFVELDVGQDEIERRAAIDMAQDQSEEMPRMNLVEIIAARNQAYTADIDRIRALFEPTYSNWMRLDARRSKWALKDDVRSVLEQGVLRRQTYLDLKCQAKAAPIAGVGLSRTHVANNLGKFKDYCPVSYVDANELRRAYDMRYMAEFQEIFYCLCGPGELDAFLANPTAYTNGKDLPASLPEYRPKSDIKSLFPKQLELRGYCPVTFHEGPPGFSSIVLGSDECIVEYAGRIYAMRDAAQMDKFMRTPWKYTDLVLPSKLPPPHAPIGIAGLPIIGYLEQTVASSLMDGLTALGNAKPKHPFKSLDVSACEFLALHLKAHNPRSKEWVRKSYAKRLEAFKDRCELLRALTLAIAGRSGFVPVDQRPPDFDRKLDALLSLRPVPSEPSRGSAAEQ